MKEETAKFSFTGANVMIPFFLCKRLGKIQANDVSFIDDIIVSIINIDVEKKCQMFQN